MTAFIRPHVLHALVGVLAFALVLWAGPVLNDGDSWWQVEAGRVMIAQGAVLKTDPFSYTFGGHPWPTHEWFSEVLFGGAFNLADWRGVLVLTASAAGLAAWLFSRELGRRVVGLPHLCLLLLSLSMFAPHLLARPHILAAPILVAWAAELIRARDEDRGPRWVFLALMLLWANMHGSFLFGLALIGPFALEALITAAPERRLGVTVRWGAFGLASLAAALVTPHGLSGFLFPLKHSTIWALSRTNEWLAADFSSLIPLEIALLAGIFVALTRPLKLTLLRALMLVGLVHVSLNHIRHEQMLAVVGGLILAGPLARAYDQDGVPAPASRRATALAGVGAAVVIAMLAAGRLATPVVWHDSEAAPVTALAAVPAELRAQPVVNDFIFGAYLIGQGVRPFIDSRTELYGDPFLKAYARLQDDGDPKEVAQVLRERDARWTILTADTPLVRAMDAQPGWRRLHADQWAVVHVRTATNPPPK